MSEKKDYLQKLFRSSTLQNTSGTLVILSLRMCAQAGTLILLARALETELFGYFVGITALAVMLGTLSTAGSHFVLLSETAKGAQKTGAFQYAIPVTLVTGTGLALVFLGIVLFGLPDAPLPLSLLVVIALTELVLQPLLNIPSAIRQGEGRIIASQALVTVPLLLRFLFMLLIFAVAREKALTLYIVASAVIALAIGAITLKQDLGPQPHLRLPRRDELRNMTGYGVLSFTSTAPTELDKAIAARFLVAHEAGLYALASRVIGALTLPVVAMMQSLLPWILSAYQNGNKPRRTVLLFVFIASLGMSLVLGALIQFVAPWLHLVFGTNYEGLASAVILLTYAVPAMALRFSAGSTLVGIGFPWIRVVLDTAGILVMTLTVAGNSVRMNTEALIHAVIFAEWVMAILGWVMILTLRVLAAKKAALTGTGT